MKRTRRCTKCRCLGWHETYVKGSCLYVNLNTYMYRETNLDRFRTLWVKDWLIFIAQNCFILSEIVYLLWEKNNAFYSIAFYSVKNGQRFLLSLRCWNTTHAMCANAFHPVLDAKIQRMLCVLATLSTGAVDNSMSRIVALMSLTPVLLNSWNW